MYIKPFTGKTYGMRVYNKVLSPQEILKATMEFYFIDTIYDNKSGKTYFYVIHLLKNGNRVVVNNSFETYEEARLLMEELNEDLL
jgi:hypothetical protein